MLATYPNILIKVLLILKKAKLKLPNLQVHYVHSLRYILRLRILGTASSLLLKYPRPLVTPIVWRISIWVVELFVLYASYNLALLLKHIILQLWAKRDSNHSLQRDYATYGEPMYAHIKNITYLHRQVMKNLILTMKKNTNVIVKATPLCDQWRMWDSNPLRPPSLGHILRMQVLEFLTRSELPANRKA